MVSDTILERFLLPADLEAALRTCGRILIPASAAELMERFVRGDRARSGEGSGLGLSIARSLTELQHGSFSLTVDGDLFKVELVFPGQAALSS